MAAAVMEITVGVEAVEAVVVTAAEAVAVATVETTITHGAA